MCWTALRGLKYLNTFLLGNNDVIQVWDSYAELACEDTEQTQSSKAHIDLSSSVAQTLIELPAF